MKKILPLFIILLTAFLPPAYSQTKKAQKSDEEIKTLICHNWQLVQMETKGKVYPQPPEKTFSVLVNKDGTIVETDQSTTYPGKWTLSHGIFSVTNDGKGPVEKYKIIKITETELIYESNEDGTPTKMKMKRVD